MPAARPQCEAGDNYNDGGAFLVNAASLLLAREVFGGCGRRAVRDRRGAAAAAAAAAAFAPRSSSLTTTDPSSLLLAWAETALLRHARSRYLDMPPDPATTTAPTTTAPRGGAAVAARFSADGALLCCSLGGNDPSLRVWCAASGRALCTLRGHARTPWCVAWHPNRPDTLASGSLDGAVLVWRLERPPRSPPPPLAHDDQDGDDSDRPAWSPFYSSSSPSSSASSSPTPRMRRPPRLVGGRQPPRDPTSDDGLTSPPASPPPPPPPAAAPPLLRPRLVARHDFRRPVASLAFSPGGDTLAVQAGRRMYAWQYEAEASPAASPRADGGRGVGAAAAAGAAATLAGTRPPPLRAAAVSAAAAAALTAPVGIWTAKGMIRLASPHPMPGVPLLLTAEVLPTTGSGGGGGGGGGAISSRHDASSPAPLVTLRDLPPALSEAAMARLLMRRRRCGGAGGRGLPQRRQQPGSGEDKEEQEAAADNAGPRAAAVAAAQALLRLRLADSQGADLSRGDGVPPYLLGELIGAASEAWARATAEGGGGGAAEAGAARASPQQHPAGQEAAPPLPRTNGEGPSRPMRDLAWGTRTRQWISQQRERRLGEEEREALAGGEGRGPRDEEEEDDDGEEGDNARAERAPSAPGLVAALPASTRTFSPEWLLPSSAAGGGGGGGRPGTAAVAPSAAPLPSRQQEEPRLYTTAELPGYLRHWAADEAGGDRQVHLGGSGGGTDSSGGQVAAAPPGAVAAVAAAASAAAPAIAAAAEAFRAAALEACQGAQALPCLATLRLWRWEEDGGGEGGPLEDAGAPPRRAAPAALRPPRLLKLLYVVLCSEVSASISPCGRMLAAVVARRPRHPLPGLFLGAPSGGGEQQQQQQQQQQQDGGGGADDIGVVGSSSGLEHAVYELHVYSIEQTPVAAAAACGQEEEEDDEEGGERGGSCSLRGRLLRARRIPAAHCLTTVQFSPTGAHLMLAYGRRHISLCSLAVRPADGGAGGGAAAAATTAPPPLPRPPEVVPVHSVVEFYRADDLSLARVLPSLSDEVNAAAWRGGGGGGASVWGAAGAAASPPAFAYTTKDGRVRLVELSSG
jgi:hypothetical protein